MFFGLSCGSNQPGPILKVPAFAGVTEGEKTWENLYQDDRPVVSNPGLLECETNALSIELQPLGSVKPNDTTMMKKFIHKPRRIYFSIYINKEKSEYTMLL